MTNSSYCTIMYHYHVIATCGHSWRHSANITQSSFNQTNSQIHVSHVFLNKTII